jgi:hypothetical protein
MKYMTNSDNMLCYLSFAAALAVTGFNEVASLYNAITPPHVEGINGTVVSADITNTNQGDFTLDDLAVIQIPSEQGNTVSNGALVVYTGPIEYCLNDRQGGLAIPNTWRLTEYQPDNYLCDSREGTVLYTVD